MRGERELGPAGLQGAGGPAGSRPWGRAPQRARGLFVAWGQRPRSQHLLALHKDAKAHRVQCAGRGCREDAGPFPHRVAKMQTSHLVRVALRHAESSPAASSSPGLMAGMGSFIPPVGTALLLFLAVPRGASFLQAALGSRCAAGSSWWPCSTAPGPRSRSAPTSQGPGMPNGVGRIHTSRIVSLLPGWTDRHKPSLPMSTVSRAPAPASSSWLPSVGFYT